MDAILCNLRGLGFGVLYLNPRNYGTPLYERSQTNFPASTVRGGFPGSPSIAASPRMEEFQKARAFGFRVKGLGRLHAQGRVSMRRWRHPTSRNLWVAAGLSSRPPPAVRHHRLPPNLFPVHSGLGLRPQFPPQQDRLLANFQVSNIVMTGPPQAGSPSGASLIAPTREFAAGRDQDFFRDPPWKEAENVGATF